MSRQSDPVLFSNTQRFGPVLRLLRESGFDPSRILTEYDLTEAQLLDPRTRVPRELIVRAFQTVAAALPDPEAIGIRAAACFQLNDIGLLGYLARYSAHVLDALQHFARYARLMADAAECEVQVKHNRVVLSVGLIGARPISAQGIDYALATMLVGVRELTVPSITPLAVKLARPTPRDPKPFHQLFGVRVEFAAQRSELVFDRADALVPARAHDPQLLAILERQADASLAGLPELCSLIEQVRALIAESLEHGTHDAANISSRLGLSERTLRRRLEQAGQSHRVLLDQVRRERAQQLIAREQLSIVEVAQRVGFSDPSAFATAFRRWTGRSPRAVRASRNTT